MDGEIQLISGGVLLVDGDGAMAAAAMIEDAGGSEGMEEADPGDTGFGKRDSRSNDCFWVVVLLCNPKNMM